MCLKLSYNSTFDNGKREQQPPQISIYNPYTLSHSNILDAQSHRYELGTPVWPKIIINSPAHHHQQQQQQLPPPMSDNKYSRYRSNNSVNNINGRKISNSCDNILNDEDETFIVNGGGLVKTFDLDQIEYERRKSHAALFDHNTIQPTSFSMTIGHKGQQRGRDESRGGGIDDDGTPV